VSLDVAERAGDGQAMSRKPIQTCSWPALNRQLGVRAFQPWQEPPAGRPLRRSFAFWLAPIGLPAKMFHGRSPSWWVSFPYRAVCHSRGTDSSHLAPIGQWLIV